MWQRVEEEALPVEGWRAVLLPLLPTADLACQSPEGRVPAQGGASARVARPCGLGAA